MAYEQVIKHEPRDDDDEIEIDFEAYGHTNESVLNEPVFEYAFVKEHAVVSNVAPDIPITRNEFENFVICSSATGVVTLEEIKKETVQQPGENNTETSTNEECAVHFEAEKDFDLSSKTLERRKENAKSNFLIQIRKKSEEILGRRARTSEGDKVRLSTKTLTRGKQRTKLISAKQVQHCSKEFDKILSRRAVVVLERCVLPSSSGSRTKICETNRVTKPSGKHVSAKTNRKNQRKVPHISEKIVDSRYSAVDGRNLRRIRKIPDDQVAQCSLCNDERRTVERRKTSNERSFFGALGLPQSVKQFSLKTNEVSQKKVTLHKQTPEKLELRNLRRVTISKMTKRRRKRSLSVKRLKQRRNLSSSSTVSTSDDENVECEEYLPPGTNKKNPEKVLQMSEKIVDSRYSAVDGINLRRIRKIADDQVAQSSPCNDERRTVERRKTSNERSFFGALGLRQSVEQVSLESHKEVKLDKQTPEKLELRNLRRVTINKMTKQRRERCLSFRRLKQRRNFASSSTVSTSDDDSYDDTVECEEYLPPRKNKKNPEKVLQMSEKIVDLRYSSVDGKNLRRIRKLADDQVAQSSPCNDEKRTVERRKTGNESSFFGALGLRQSVERFSLETNEVSQKKVTPDKQTPEKLELRNLRRVTIKKMTKRRQKRSLSVRRLRRRRNFASLSTVSTTDDESYDETVEFKEYVPPGMNKKDLEKLRAGARSLYAGATNLRRSIRQETAKQLEESSSSNDNETKTAHIKPIGVESERKPCTFLFLSGAGKNAQRKSINRRKNCTFLLLSGTAKENDCMIASGCSLQQEDEYLSPETGGKSQEKVTETATKLKLTPEARNLRRSKRNETAQQLDESSSTEEDEKRPVTKLRKPRILPSSSKNQCKIVGENNLAVQGNKLSLPATRNESQEKVRAGDKNVGRSGRNEIVQQFAKSSSAEDEEQLAQSIPMTVERSGGVFVLRCLPGNSTKNYCKIVNSFSLQQSDQHLLPETAKESQTKLRAEAVSLRQFRRSKTVIQPQKRCSSADDDDGKISPRRASLITIQGNPISSGASTKNCKVDDEMESEEYLSPVKESQEKITKTPEKSGLAAKVQSLNRICRQLEVHSLSNVDKILGRRRENVAERTRMNRAKETPEKRLQANEERRGRRSNETPQQPAKRRAARTSINRMGKERETLAEHENSIADRYLPHENCVANETPELIELLNVCDKSISDANDSNHCEVLCDKHGYLVAECCSCEGEGKIAEKNAKPVQTEPCASPSSSGVLAKIDIEQDNESSLPLAAACEEHLTSKIREENPEKLTKTPEEYEISLRNLKVLKKVTDASKLEERHSADDEVEIVQEVLASNHNNNCQIDDENSSSLEVVYEKDFSSPKTAQEKQPTIDEIFDLSLSDDARKECSSDDEYYPCNADHVSSDDEYCTSDEEDVERRSVSPSVAETPPKNLNEHNYSHFGPGDSESVKQKEVRETAERFEERCESVGEEIIAETRSSPRVLPSVSESPMTSCSGIDEEHCYSIDKRKIYTTLELTETAETIKHRENHALSDEAWRSRVKRAKETTKERYTKFYHKNHEDRMEITGTLFIETAEQRREKHRLVVSSAQRMQIEISRETPEKREKRLAAERVTLRNFIKKYFPFMEKERRNEVAKETTEKVVRIDEKLETQEKSSAFTESSMNNPTSIAQERVTPAEEGEKSLASKDLVVRIDDKLETPEELERRLAAESLAFRESISKYFAYFAPDGTMRKVCGKRFRDKNVVEGIVVKELKTPEEEARLAADRKEHEMLFTAEMLSFREWREANPLTEPQFYVFKHLKIRNGLFTGSRMWSEIETTAVQRFDDGRAEKRGVSLADKCRATRTERVGRQSGTPEPCAAEERKKRLAAMSKSPAEQQLEKQHLALEYAEQLAKRRKSRVAKRANETPEEREKRLECRRARYKRRCEAQMSEWKRRMANQTPEQREKRLKAEAEKLRRRIANETPVQREKRLKTKAESWKRRVAMETPEEQEKRLEKIRALKKKKKSEYQKAREAGTEQRARRRESNKLSMNGRRAAKQADCNESPSLHSNSLNTSSAGGTLAICSNNPSTHAVVETLDSDCSKSLEVATEARSKNSNTFTATSAISEDHINTFSKCLDETVAISGGFVNIDQARALTNSNGLDVDASSKTHTSIAANEDGSETLTEISSSKIAVNYDIIYARSTVSHDKEQASGTGSSTFYVTNQDGTSTEVVVVYIDGVAT